MNRYYIVYETTHNNFITRHKDEIHTTYDLHEPTNVKIIENELKQINNGCDVCLISFEELNEFVVF